MLAMQLSCRKRTNYKSKAHAILYSPPDFTLHPRASAPVTQYHPERKKIGFSAFSSNLDITSGPLHKLRLIKDFRTPKKGNQRISENIVGASHICPLVHRHQNQDAFFQHQQISLKVDLVFQCNGFRPPRSKYSVLKKNSIRCMHSSYLSSLGK